MADRIWSPMLILFFALYALMRVDLYLKFKGYQQTVEKILKKDRLSIFAFLNYKESQVMDLVKLAWRFKRKTNIQRNILADHMDNRLKSAFGGGSHMSCIIAKGGRLIFQSNWLDAKVLKTAIDDLLVHAEISGKVGEFQCHSIHFRKFPVEEYIQGLEKNGPAAVMDVIKKIVKRNGFSGFYFNENIAK